MEIYTTSQARESLYRLVDHVAEAHEPVYIVGKRNKVVLIAEEDFRAIEETLYLLSVPGLRQSLLDAKKEPIEKCSDSVDWS